ncbi:MAG: hypothetical protein ACKVQB_08725 [Bacteroidia bacterium]
MSGSKRFFLNLLLCVIGIVISIPHSVASKIDPDSSYKVAMILPLHLHNYNGTNVNRTNIMLDYYQGFYLALKDYEKLGLKIKVFVYDNEHDTGKTKEILGKPEMKDMDVIISPILDEHLHIINHFSCKYQIPVFSPFTAIDSLFPNNPLFFNAAPAKKTKAEVFYDYYRKTNPDNIVLILKNDAEWEKGIGKELLELLETKNNIDYRLITADEMAKADSNFLPKGKEYIVYHGSEDAKSFKHITTFLDKQKATFEIVGDYKPQTLKTIPESKRKKYRIKIISGDFTNPLDSGIVLRDFKINYKIISNLNPSRYSVIGHDQASFICEILMKYDRFRANDFTGDIHQYYATKFLFKKDRHCNQNKGLFILKISDLDFLEEVKY